MESGSFPKCGSRRSARAHPSLNFASVSSMIVANVPGTVFLHDVVMSGRNTCWFAALKSQEWRSG
eukprot:7678693-Pyramimonas_sp.AAC.1